MFRRYLVIMLVLFTSIVGVHAQDKTATAPIIALSKGDFWAINPDDGSVTQITHNKQDLDFFQPFSQMDLALSPDGQYLAYLKTPVFFAIAMRNNLFGDLGEFPTDVVLLNLITGEEQVIAPQQANVKYSEWERLWYRANLVWSPDSSQLAYYQRRGTTSDDYQAQVGVYNRLTTKTLKFAVQIDAFDHEIAWLPQGLGVSSTIYDNIGKIIKQHQLNAWVNLSHWVTYQGQVYKVVDTFGFKVPEGQIYLMNALTGEFSVVESYEASISAANTENTLMFFGDVNNGVLDYVLNPQTGSRFVPSQDANATNFVFSPDGKQFAYIASMNTINISDLNGYERTIDFQASAIVWGNKQYTIASESGDQSALTLATSYLDTDPHCGTLPPVGLVAGGQGRVVMGGSSNRLRVDPFVTSEVIALMPGGSIFNVIEGSQTMCNDQIRWVQVEYNGIIGWTAEGADGELFLEAVQ